MKIVLIFIAAFASCIGDGGGQCWELQTKMQACADGTLNTVNGLDGIFSTSSSSMGINLESMTKEILHDMCTNMRTIETFITCAYREMNACIRSEARGTLPSTDSVVESISYLCDNSEEVSFTCATASSPEAERCMRAASKTPQSDMANRDTVIKYMCGQEGTRVSCLKEAMDDCPKKTAEIMSKFLEYQKPVACDAPMVRITSGLLVISLCYTWFKNMIRE